MNCIKTGAWVFLPEYGAGAPADLFAVDRCTVVRFPKAFDECCFYGDQPRSISHLAFTEGGWWRKDLGVLVIPNALIEEVL